MDIKEFFTKYPAADIWKSHAEEHNRYCRAPKGIPILKWAVGLLRLKYEFFPHVRKFKDYFED